MEDTRGQVGSYRTGVVESGNSVRKLKCNEQLLFRGESYGFVNFSWCQQSPNLLGRREALRPGNEDVAVDFVFIAPSYMETSFPLPLRTMTL